jgi:hypothetical protein
MGRCWSRELSIVQSLSGLHRPKLVPAQVADLFEGQFIHSSQAKILGRHFESAERMVATLPSPLALESMLPFERSTLAEIALSSEL